MPAPRPAYAINSLERSIDRWSPRVRVVLPALAILLACRADNFEPRLPDGPGDIRPHFSVTTSDTLNPVADAMLRSAPANHNHGGYDSLRTKVVVGNSDTNRTLIRFDQAAIAAKVGSGTLVSAKLELTIKASGWYDDGNDVAVHRMTHPWAEYAVTWRCAEDPDESDSYANCPATRWDMSGSGAYPTPFVTTATDIIHLNGGQTGVVQLDVTADVAAFLTGTTNQGWMLKIASENRSQRVSYWSREKATGKPRLVLVVDSGWTQLNGTIPFLDTTKTVTIPGDTFRLYQTEARIRFKSSVSDAAKAAFLTSKNLLVLGVDPTNAFYVRFADRGTTISAYDAFLDSLRAAPEADIVAPLFRTPLAETESARYPTDGSGFNRQDYLGTSQSTWALRAVRAPLAWGCENGMYDSARVRVGLFEWKHDNTHPEFAASIPTVRQPSNNLLSASATVPSSTVDGRIAHSTGTTGLLTAAGDNSQGVAGLMWRTRLFQYAGYSASNRRMDLQQAFYAMADSVTADGVRVLSLSVDGAFPAGFNKDDQEAIVRDIAATLRLKLFGANPGLLVVIAAGNERFRGTPEAYVRANSASALRAAFLLLTREAAYQDRIVVVTGTRPGNQFWNTLSSDPSPRL
jgi:hypothetical protein